MEEVRVLTSEGEGKGKIWYRELTRLRFLEAEKPEWSVDDIREVFERFPVTRAVFNCTGLGSYCLKVVEDKLLYPARVGVPFSLNVPENLELTGSRARWCSLRIPKLQWKECIYVLLKE